MAEGGEIKPGTPSRKYKLLQKYQEELARLIGPEVATVVEETFSKELITSNDKEEANSKRLDEDGRAYVVLDSVLRKVEADQNHFDTFLSVLRGIRATKQIADKLEQESKQQNMMDISDSIDSISVSEKNSLSVSTVPQQPQDITTATTTALVANGVATSPMSSQPKLISQHVTGKTSSEELVVSTSQSQVLQRAHSEPSSALKSMVAGLKETSSGNGSGQKYLHPTVAEMPSEGEANLVVGSEVSKSRESVQESQGTTTSAAFVYSDRTVNTPQNTEQIIADTQAQMNKTFEVTKKELRAKDAVIIMKDQENCQLRQKIKELEKMVKDKEALLKTKEQEIMDIKQKNDAEIGDLNIEIQKLQTRIASLEKEKDDMVKLHEGQLSALNDEHKEKCEKLEKSLQEAIAQKEKVEKDLIDLNRELELKKAQKRADVAEKLNEIYELKATVSELQRELHEKKYQLQTKDKEHMEEMHKKEIELKDTKYELLQKEHNQEMQDVKQKHQAEKEEMNKQHSAERRRSEHKIQTLETQISQASQSSSASGQNLERQFSHGSHTSMTSQMSQISLGSIDEGDKQD